MRACGVASGSGSACVGSWSGPACCDLGAIHPFLYLEEILRCSSDRTIGVCTLYTDAAAALLCALPARRPVPAWPCGGRRERPGEPRKSKGTLFRRPRFYLRFPRRTDDSVRYTTQAEMLRCRASRHPRPTLPSASQTIYSTVVHYNTEMREALSRLSLDLHHKHPFLHFHIRIHPYLIACLD